MSATLTLLNRVPCVTCNAPRFFRAHGKGGLSCESCGTLLMVFAYTTASFCTFAPSEFPAPPSPPPADADSASANLPAGTGTTWDGPGSSTRILHDEWGTLAEGHGR